MRRRLGTGALVAVTLGLVVVTGVSSGGISSSTAARPTIISRDGLDIAVLRLVDRPDPDGAAAPNLASSQPAASSPVPTAPRGRIPSASASTPAPARGAAVEASVATRFDLDGDGLDELVVSGFGYTGLSGGYSVFVDYSGVPARDVLAPLVTSPTAPNFGEAIAMGDFNGDGYGDLVVSNPGELVPGTPSSVGAFAGGVWVFYGGADGLNPATPQHLNQDTPGVPDEMEPYDMFGSDLAAGDIDGDGFADLAVGAPGESAGSPEVDDAGSVTILRGSSSGLSTTSVERLTQDSLGSGEVVQRWDVYGRGLAIGDVTGDDRADLLVGSPGQDDGGAQFGLITLYRNTPAGLAFAGSVGGRPGENPRAIDAATLGEMLTVADVNGDGLGDIIAAVPRYGGGRVAFIPGRATGLSNVGANVIDQMTPGVPGENRWVPDDTPNHFGSSVATGDVTGDGYADVIVGAIGDNVGGLKDAGSVTLLPGSVDGLTGAGAVALTQLLPGQAPADGMITNPAEPFEYFGHSVAILNRDGVGPPDLFTGSGREKRATETNSSGLLVQFGYRFAQPPAPPPARPGLAGAGIDAGSALDTDGQGIAPVLDATDPPMPGRVRSPVPVLYEIASWPGSSWASPGGSMFGLGERMLSS